MVCGDNTHGQLLPTCAHVLWTQVLPFAFLSAPGLLFTSEDTVTPATMSSKDSVTLNYLERTWCLPS